VIGVSEVFLTRGVGKHKEKLASFEMALRDARLAHFNIVRVSSILPAGARIVSRDVGLKQLEPGQIVFTVISDNATNEPHRLIGSRSPRPRSSTDTCLSTTASGRTK
jgi:arginine decarboxylase